MGPWDCNCIANLTLHLSGDAFDGVMGRKHRALLPPDEMRKIVSSKISSALRFVELSISGIALDVPVVGERAERVGNPRPTDVDRLGEQVRAAGMELLHRSARSVEFGLH